VSLTFKILGTSETITLNQFSSVVAGYTGRDAAAVQHHIDELAAIGVAPPAEIPMFYSVEPSTVNSSKAYSESENLTSGEVEPVYIRHAGSYFLGVGSDHTDRDLERTDIGDSKRACPKPVGAEVVRIGDAAELENFSLDCADASCSVDGALYQAGKLDGLRPPHDIVKRYIARFGLHEEDDFVCFGGTLPLLGGTFTAGEHWHLEIRLSDGSQLIHNYRMKGHAA
jgi:hypothetical protein